MQPYKQAWEQFRQAVIELDGGRCVRCHRSEDEDGVVLQVHHKQYIRCREPWDYPTELCETLCKGCHARQHGLIPPGAGWECVGFHDLEEPVGTCELCGTSIRYVFLVRIDGWPAMEVGEICCDNLTSSELATNHMDSVRRYESRRRTFIGSSRWKILDSETYELTQKGICVQIVRAAEGFAIKANDVIGRRSFPTLLKCKSWCFELLETGELRDFLFKVGKLKT
ncbi:HNH endonuclease [Brevundimonas sp.]|uniref:HNH endonuclease n=1 Tax=Brevundimonas sp. TaxID=1871086 RepID=UPI002FC7BF94